MADQNKEGFTRYTPYIAFGLLNAFLWLFLMIVALGMMSGCASSKPPSFEEIKSQLAEKDTLQREVPVIIPLKPDSASISFIPELLPVNVPVKAKGKEGRITLSATRREDSRLEISAVQLPDTVRDTVRIEVPVYLFNECKVDGHITKQEADKLTKTAIKEDRQSRNSLALNIGIIVGAMFLLVILILALLKRFLP